MANNSFEIYNITRKWIPFLIVLLTIPSISQWLNIEIGNTTFWWGVESLFLILIYAFSILYYSYEYRRRIIYRLAIFRCAQKAIKQKTTNLYRILFLLKIRSKLGIDKIHFPLPILLFIFYVLVSILHGVYKASYYWDWKLLVSNIMFYLIPITFYYFSIPSNVKKVSNTWVKYSCFLFILLLPVMQRECPGRFLFPFAFFIILWPYYNKKGIILCFVAFACVFIFGSLGARSSVLRFLTSILFSLFILFRRFISKYIYLFISVLLLATPLVLFSLGVSNTFNIFKIGEYIDIDITVDNTFEKGKTENLSTDTRTFLYEETIMSSIEHDYWLFGNSLSQGYYAKMFAELDEVKGRGMRYSTEVCILNVYTNLGVVGIILYFSIFIYTIINVFINSCNKSLFVVAMLLSFRWFFSFLEEFTRFDLNNIYLWIEIAMCNSSYFLKMSDSQFIKWARNLVI